MQKKIFSILLIGLFLLGCNNPDMPESESSSIVKSFKTTLISVKENTHSGNWSLNSRDLLPGSNAAWSVKMTRLHGGKQEGVDMIEVDNGNLKFSVIPTRGMSIFQVVQGDMTLGWDSPVQEIVNPAFMHLEDNGGLGWLEGFNEWMVRCGVEFSGHPGMDQGKMLPLHGKIGNIPASEVQVVIDEEAPHRIRIRGLVKEVYFNGPNLELWTEISTEPGSNSFRIEDRVTNAGPNKQEFMMLYHANFGPPLLEEGAKLLGTIDKVLPFDDFAAKDIERWDTYGPAQHERAEQVYCIYPLADEKGNAHFLLQNALGDQAVSFQYPISQLPYFTQWKNENPVGYVTGLEPGTGFPHNRSVERKYDRVPTLQAAESRNFTLEYTLHSSKEAVQNALSNIKQLSEKELEVVAEVIAK